MSIGIVATFFEACAVDVNFLLLIGLLFSLYYACFEGRYVVVRPHIYLLATSVVLHIINKSLLEYIHSKRISMIWELGDSDRITDLQEDAIYTARAVPHYIMTIIIGPYLYLLYMLSRGLYFKWPNGS